MKYIKIQRAGDPQKRNRENAGFVTSSKFTYLKNLHAYSSLHAPGLPQGMYHNLLLEPYEKVIASTRQPQSLLRLPQRLQLVRLKLVIIPCKC